jgi:hypothetical protein
VNIRAPRADEHRTHPDSGRASVSSRRRSRAATRRAATELAAHRRRLLELAVEAELDPSDALLMRVDPANHPTSLARIAGAAFAVAPDDAHLTRLKAAAADSRPTVGSGRTNGSGEAAGPNSTAQAAGSSNLNTNVNVSKRSPRLAA